MARILYGSILVASLFACAPAYAAPAPLVASPNGVRSPYEVEILDEDGSELRTYWSRGRYYVLGEHGDRYQIHVTNPTPRRIEAVITVDGLDVIDGENGDLRKRGYVIQPYGDLQVEGFRTSTTDVATFRFSSVGASYAGRKGKARNVGVIAVAIFDERAQPRVYLPAPRPPTPYYYDDEGADLRGPGASPQASRGGRGKASAPTESAPAPAAPPSASPSRSASVDASGTADAPSANRRSDREESACCGNRRERAGLGTEYGEQRYSAVNFTSFVRASSRPSAVAELRYNDAPGLMALGIPLSPEPDDDEIMTRETAQPFPGDHRFSRPPAGVY